jgi:hypothetical protein
VHRHAVGGGFTLCFLERIALEDDYFVKRKL